MLNCLMKPAVWSSPALRHSTLTKLRALSSKAGMEGPATHIHTLAEPSSARTPSTPEPSIQFWNLTLETLTTKLSALSFSWVLKKEKKISFKHTYTQSIEIQLLENKRCNVIKINELNKNEIRCPLLLEASLKGYPVSNNTILEGKKRKATFCSHDYIESKISIHLPSKKAY
jgi:hypothetical protein